METAAVASANILIASFIERNARVLARKAWYEYTTFAEVEEALRLHRMRKKFCLIDDEQAQARRDRTIGKFLTQNNRNILTRSAEWYYLHENASNMWFLREARRLVHSLFSEVRFKYVPVAASRSTTYVEKRGYESYSSVKHRFAARQARLILGPGEQFLSAHGDVSQLAKIHHHTWTVTRQAEPWAKEAVWHDRAWRRVVIRDGISRLREHKVSRGALSLADWKRLVFEVGWKKRVQVVHGSRLTTVPKNNEIDRLINVEPLLNVGLQKWLGQLLEEGLQRVGISLDRNQQLHKLLVKNLDYATIDFSAASDSYGVGLVEYLFPKDIALALMTVRSNTFEYDVTDDKGRTQVRERANVYACMGNGTTFAVLTTIVWALATAARGVHGYAYGDDLITPTRRVANVMFAFETVGFTVNRDKSFTDGPVRESCGAFTFNGEYLRSYDIKACESYADIIVTANKIRRYLDWSPWKSRWFDLWAGLCSLVGKNHYGPIADWDNPRDVVPWLESPMDSANAGSGLLEWFHQMTGVPCRIVTGVVWRQKVLEPDVPAFDLSLMRIGIGSEPTRHLRGEGEWVEQSFVVANDGRMLGSVKEIRRIRTDYIKWYNARICGPFRPTRTARA